MPLGYGLNVGDDLDSRMREYVDKIKQLSGEISEKNSEIQATEDALNELRSAGVASPKLEQDFSNVLQKTLDEKSSLENERESIRESATRELEDAKQKIDETVDKVSAIGGNQAAEMLSALRDRATEIGEWEKELRDAVSEADNSPSIGSKRLVRRR